MPASSCWSRWWRDGRGPGTLVAVLIGWSGPVGGIAPLVILSGLLVVVAAGDGIEFSRQHVVIAAWFGLLIVPPIMAIAALVVLPWLNIDLKVTYPAQTMARFFSESFERRADRARRAEPPERFSRRHARAFALGDARCDQEQGRNRRLADQRYRRNAAGRDQGAVSGSRARGPTRIRALGAGSAAAHAHRLGGDPAPGAGGTFSRRRRAEAVSSWLASGGLGSIHRRSVRGNRLPNLQYKFQC